MGREPYLARLAFGRSAFGAPLRKDDGSSILNDKTSDQSQEYDEKGYPCNPQSAAAAKRFRKAQNEVLAACNIVVTKHGKHHRQSSHNPHSEARKFDAVDDDNVAGLVIKGLDRALGYVVSWPAVCLQRRCLTFLDTRSVTRSFQLGLGSDWHGFPAHAAAHLIRAIWQTNLDSEPLIQHANFLQLETASDNLTWTERVQNYAFTLASLLIEIPMDIVAVLQGLQLPLLPTLLQFTTNVETHNFRARRVLNALSTSKILFLVPVYLVKHYLTYHVGWTIFGFFRQVFTHPERPDELSVQAADHEDSMVDPTSIPGLGRRLGPYTDIRFYGPRSFWPALKFLARKWFTGRMLTREQQNIKAEVIQTQVRNERESYTGFGSSVKSRSARQREIVKWLENDGIDLEEDFYVDLEQWCEEIYEIRSLEKEFELEFLLLDHDGNAVDVRPDSNPNDAPQPGIRRAVSLLEATAPTTEEPLPMPPRRPGSRLRRPTESALEPPDQLNHIMNARRRRTALAAKKSSRDNRKFRVTRLSTFAADSLAWHASSVVTTLIMLPVEALYCRTVALWFTSINHGSLTNRAASILGFSQWSGGSGKWPFVRALLVAVAVECACRGVLWQLETMYVMQYGRRFTGWGRF